MTVFASDVVDAVLRHMNDDHRDDNLLIVKAFAGCDAADAEMSGLDEHAGIWRYLDGGEWRELRLAWSTELRERPEIRREVVRVYREACARLGVEPRAEERREH